MGLKYPSQYKKATETGIVLQGKTGFEVFDQDMQAKHKLIEQSVWWLLNLGVIVEQTLFCNTMKIWRRFCFLFFFCLFFWNIDLYFL